jgi:hypothetical protein
MIATAGSRRESSVRPQIGLSLRGTSRPPFIRTGREATNVDGGRGVLRLSFFGRADIVKGIGPVRCCDGRTY